MKSLWIILLLLGPTYLSASTVKVVHLTVALCDNTSQGIVPVGNGLCDGDVPQQNLYWGALYGVRTYINKHEEWKKVEIIKGEQHADILDRRVYSRHIKEKDLEVFLVADAWKGSSIITATSRFIEMNAGLHPQDLFIKDKNVVLEVGGQG